MSRSKEYRVWNQMIQRCTNPNYRGWKDYGGRGIKVCDRWLVSFITYHKDILEKLGPKPSPEYSLDRIDNDGNYEIDNMRWATRGEQQINRRPYRRKLQILIKDKSKIKEKEKHKLGMKYVGNGKWIIR